MKLSEFGNFLSPIWKMYCVCMYAMCITASLKLIANKTTAHICIRCFGTTAHTLGYFWIILCRRNIMKTIVLHSKMKCNHNLGHRLKMGFYSWIEFGDNTSCSDPKTQTKNWISSGLTVNVNSFGTNGCTSFGFISSRVHIPRHNRTASIN